MHVQAILSQDLLAPLVASALFPDFLQRFLPFPVALFDRGRALEHALENATASEMKDGGAVMSSSFLANWNARNSAPALLMNATNSASGRRVVISPFDLTSLGDDGAWRRDIVQYPFWPGSSDLAGPSTKLTTRVAPDIRLSTAAFISARFPWITPAASVPIRDEVTGETVKVRLVDGGYSDNSGVETAMDLMERLSIGADGYISFHEAETADDLPLPPRARVSLIALTGGDFPVRTSFAFGELMEPIRAMLNVRQSRAYAAISRAAQLYPPTPAGQFDYEGQATIVKVDTVRLVVLDNPYYALPLGWALSDRSRARSSQR